MRKYTIKDIVDNDLCTGCGLCVSESDTGRMVWNDFGFLVPDVINANFNEKAISLCPFNPSPGEPTKDEDSLAEIFLKESSNFNEKLGRFENTYIGYSVEYRETSSSGGLATYIFSELLKKKIVDKLFIVKENNGEYEYQFFDNPECITEISKTRYFPVTLEKLFKEIDSVSGTVAVSGIGCFIKAIRLKQIQNPELREKIPFLIGIICGGMKSRFFTKYLAQKAGIVGKYFHPEYRIKDPNSTSLDYSFGAYDENGIYHEIKMASLPDMWGTGYFKANACDYCTDVTTELADISLGDAWLPEYKPDGLGNSVIITRTKLADKLVIDGVLSGKLNVKTIGVDAIIESQRGSYTHRHDGLYFRVKWMNRGRLLPYIRKRVFRKTLPLNSLIQINRRLTRVKSLHIWRKVGNATLFDKRMNKYLFFLKYLTLLLHYYRNLTK